jgi:WD40 repeat protein
MNFSAPFLRRAAVATAAAVLAACAVQVPVPPMPSVRMPTPEEIFEAQQKRSGKTAHTERAAADGIQVVFQTGHAGIISSVAMSADGRYILSSGWDETAKLWDVASGQELRTLTGLGMTGGNVAFVSDAERVVVGDAFEGRRLIDLATGTTLRELGSLNAPAAISGNGRYAAVADESTPSGGRRIASSASLISIHDLARDQVVATLSMQGRAAPITVSDDGRSVLVRRLDFTLRGPVAPLWQIEIWDVSAKKPRSTFPLEGIEGQAPVLSPDGRLLATSTLTGNVKIYSTASGKQQLELSAGDVPATPIASTLVFSRDGRLLASAAQTGPGSMRDGARVWEIASGRAVTSFDASAVNFSTDGRTLIVGRQSGGAPVMRDLETGEESRLAGGASAVIDLALIDDGSSVAAATELGGVQHWNLETGQLLRTFDCPGGTGTRSVSASTANPWLATSCNDGGVYVWNLQGGQLLHTLNPPAPGKLGVLANVRFDPKGRRLAFTVNEQLAVWDVLEGRELRRVTLPRGQSMFASSASDLAEMPEEMREQYARQLEQSGVTEEWQHAVHALAFDPTGRYVAIGKMSSPALLVDIESGEVVRRFTKGALAQQTDSPSQEAVLQQMFGKLPRKQKKMLEDALAKAGVKGGAGAVVFNSRSEVDDLLDESDVIGSLAFSPDGRRLFTLGTRGKRVWDVASGTPIEQQDPRTATSLDPYAALDVDSILASVDDMAVRSGGIAVTPDGRLAARGHGNLVKLWDVASDQDVTDLAGHTSDVTSVVYAAKARLLVSGSRDGTLRVWSVPERKEVVELIALGASDYVAVTPDQYYRASKRRITGVSFRINERLYPFEQFDLRFNRPDIVLERLGSTSPETVQAYRTAYQRRLKKMGFSEQMLNSDFHLPEVALVGTNVPVTTESTTLKLRVRATDARYPLDRLNVFVNDVPVFGTAGLALAESAQSHEQDIDVPLVPGRNKVQVSVLNRQGAESLKQTAYTTSTAEPGTPEVYVLAIGVSRYRNQAYNLRFAAKDAADLIDAYRGITSRGESRGAVHVLDLTNEKATRSAIRQAKDWLQQARANDLVVVFAAGHGMTDTRQNYYFGTHDIDPERPEINGLPYEDFEALLDGIRAMRKVLLIDTCFSGEIEQGDPVVVAQSQAGNEGTVSMRAFKAARGVSVVADDTSAASGTPALATDVLRFQQELFADLRRGTGAVVISSASGNEYALEGEQWSNGVFTYALLNGLKNAQADVNQDRTVTVSELQSYVIDEVRKLTAGGQNPTVRRENLEYDFVVH